MDIGYKIREYLRTQDEPRTAQEVGVAIGHENPESLGVILYGMVNKNQGVDRKKIPNTATRKNAPKHIYGYFSTDKDAPATAKTGETLSLQSSQKYPELEKADTHKESEKESEKEPEGDYFFIGYANGLTQEDQNGKTREFGNMEQASAEASRIASHAPGMLVEIWHAYPVKKIRARVEIEEVS